MDTYGIRDDLDELDLTLENLSAEELHDSVSAWSCAATASTVASFGCGTLSSGSSFSTGGN